VELDAALQPSGGALFLGPEFDRWRGFVPEQDSNSDAGRSLLSDGGR
jgi:hypothetical protein